MDLPPCASVRPAAVAAALVGVVVVAASCSGGGGGGPADDAEPPTTARIGVVEVDTLDPVAAVSGDAALVADLLYDTLTDLDPRRGEPEAELAEWSANEDRTVYTFTLRADARFHDGTPVTAEDVAATLARAVVPASGSPLALDLEDVEGFASVRSGAAGRLAGVEVVDDRRVRISLGAPYASLPAVLAHPALGIVPAARLGAGAALDSDPVGSGPFAYSTTTRPEAGWRLERFDAALDGPPPLDAIEIVRFDDRAAAAEALEDGAIDVAAVAAGSTGVGAQQVGAPAPAEVLLGMNLRDPTFDDVRLREAVVRGFDRGVAVAAAADAGARATDGLIPAGVPGAASSACAGICTRDTERARSLLAEVAGADGAPALALDYFDAPVNAALAEEVARQLGEIGLTVEPRPHAPGEYAEFLASGDAELFLLGWVADVPAARLFLDPLFRSGAAENVFGLDEPAVDAALDEAAATPDDDDRRARFRDAERLVLEQYAVVPLVQFEQRVAAGAGVQGLVVDALGSIDAAGLDVERPGSS